MPPAESRIGQGSLLGEPFTLSCTWQQLDGAPIFTYRLPALSNVMAFASCSCLSHKPVTIFCLDASSTIPVFSFNLYLNTSELVEPYIYPFLIAIPVPVKSP